MRNTIWIGALTVPLCLCLLAGSSSADEETVSLNYRNTDIRAVIQIMGSHIGKTFILDPRVTGKVTIVSSGPVSSDIVYDILLSTLQLHGYAVVESGGVAKVVPEADAKQNAGPVSDGRIKTSGDRIITHIYPLEYGSADRMLPILKPLIRPKNVISAYSESNTLVITDYASNIRRLDRIIRSLDQPQRGVVEAIELQYIPVTEFIGVFENVFLTRPSAAGPGSGGQEAQKGEALIKRRFTLVPDLRTNNLIVRSEDPSIVEQIKDLIATVDVPRKDEGSVRIVKLDYADPVAVAEILNKLVSQQAGGKSALGSSSEDGTPIAVGILPDETTKSLIITAPADVFKSLRTVIDQMDTRRPQIYLEAVIAEITSDKVAELGIQWQSMRGLDTNRAPDRIGIGGVNLGGSGASIGDVGGSLGAGVSIGSGLNLGIVSGTITLANGDTIPNLLALAHALETNTNANILSTPTLLTLDNHEAEINVGENIPLLTGSYAPTTGGAGGEVTPFQTIERRDVGLILKIKPQISDSGTIKLYIYQEVSSLLPPTTTAAAGPVDVVTSKRSLESTVLVEDGQTIVLGGLIQDRTTVQEEKVPFLGDLPILGHLFRFENRKKNKTNLMVFLRPFIFRAAGDSTAVTLSTYKYIIDEQGDVVVDSHFLLPDMQSPNLLDKGSDIDVQKEEPVKESGTDITRSGGSVYAEAEEE